MPELFGRARMNLILVLLAIEIGVFLVGLFTPVPTSFRQALANETGTQFAPFKTAGPVQLVTLIFSHNLLIALGEMVPGAGAVLFFTSVYTTGLAAQALVMSQGLPVAWGVALFAYPFALVELTAYAVAVASGTMVISAWRKKALHREARIFGLEALGVASILLAAAAMEATTTSSPILGFGLWLPTGVALAVAIVALRLRRA